MNIGQIIAMIGASLGIIGTLWGFLYKLFKKLEILEIIPPKLKSIDENIEELKVGQEELSRDLNSLKQSHRELSGQVLKEKISSAFFWPGGVRNLPDDLLREVQETGDLYQKDGGNGAVAPRIKYLQEEYEKRQRELGGKDT